MHGPVPVLTFDHRSGRRSKVIGVRQPCSIVVASFKAGLPPLGSLVRRRAVRLRAQGKPPVKIRYNEVVRSILYAPAYVAMTKGYFKEAGLDIELSTAQGGDKSVAALLSGSADIALIGPETAIYVQNSDSPTKIPIFCGLTATDGFMLLGREKVDKFDWSHAQGQGNPRLPAGLHAAPVPGGGTAQERHRSAKDVKLNNNVAIPARVGSWLAGQNQFGIFTEPDPSQLEVDGKGFFMASIGETVGPADYTTFMATDKYIKEHPDVIQTFTNVIYKAQKWTAVAAAGGGREGHRAVLPGREPAGA